MKLPLDKYVIIIALNIVAHKHVQGFIVSLLADQEAWRFGVRMNSRDDNGGVNHDQAWEVPAPVAFDRGHANLNG